TLLHAAQFLLRANRLSPSDRCLNIAPVFHSLGATGSVLLAAVSGGSLVCTPGFDRREFFHWIRDYSPTWFSAVPTVLLAIGELAEQQQEILERHPIRFVRSAGARLPQDTRRKIEDAVHAPIIQAYGMSECPPIAVDPPPPAQRKTGSVGVPAGPEEGGWGGFGEAVAARAFWHVVGTGRPFCTAW